MHRNFLLAVRDELWWGTASAVTERAMFTMTWSEPLRDHSCSLRSLLLCCTQQGEISNSYRMVVDQQTQPISVHLDSSDKQTLFLKFVVRSDPLTMVHFSSLGSRFRANIGDFSDLWL